MTSILLSGSQEHLQLLTETENIAQATLTALPKEEVERQETSTAISNEEKEDVIDIAPEAIEDEVEQQQPPMEKPSAHAEEVEVPGEKRKREGNTLEDVPLKEESPKKKNKLEIQDSDVTAEIEAAVGDGSQL